MQAAVNWVRGNCTHPDAIRDLSRSLLDAGAAGADCWFVIGDYPERPLWGKGMLDLSFPSIAAGPGKATNFKGPLAVFVRLCAVSSPQRPDGRPPISNAVAALVDVV